LPKEKALYIAEATELPAPPPELLRGETIPDPTMAGMGLLAVDEKPLLIVFKSCRVLGTCKDVISLLLFLKC
jgi:hypothetical protein